MKKRKAKTSGKSFHGDVSKKHGKPMDPQDHPAHDLKDLPTQAMQGKQLGTEPGPFPSSNVYGIQGGSYPGEDIGA